MPKVPYKKSNEISKRHLYRLQRKKRDQLGTTTPQETPISTNPEPGCSHRGCLGLLKKSFLCGFFRSKVKIDCRIQ